MATSKYTSVKSDKLIDIEQISNSESNLPTLLDMALTYIEKPQWHAGESIWLWRSDNRGAYLKEMGGFFVTLNLLGFRKYLIVFRLNPKTWKWEVSQNVFVKYYRWMDQYKEHDL